MAKKKSTAKKANDPSIGLSRKFWTADKGKPSGFFSPLFVVKLFVETIKSLKRSVYNPCFGSGGIILQAERSVEAHEARTMNNSLCSQTSPPTRCNLSNLLQGKKPTNQKTDSQLKFHRIFIDICLALRQLVSVNPTPINLRGVA